VRTKRPPRRALRALLTLGALAIASGATSCSVIYDLSTEQCSVDADCASRGEGLVCTNNLCSAQCISNAECLDRDDNSSESACVQSKCVYLKTAECPVLLPLDNDLVLQNLRNPNVLIVGAYTSLTALDGPYVLNFDLALNEFQSKQGGVLVKDTTRPVVMVTCNGVASGDPEAWTAQLDASIAHLADELHVPGVVSGLATADLQHVFESKGHAANMFFVSVQDSDSSLTAAQDDGLMWHMLPGGATLGRSYKPIIDRAVAFLTANGAIAAGEAVRIAEVIDPEDRFVADLSLAVQGSSAAPGISFNGMSAAQNLVADPPNFKVVNLPPKPATGTLDLTTQGQEIAAFKPHIIISAAGSAFITSLLPVIEMQWPTDGQAKPFYVLSPLQYGPGTVNALPRFPTMRSRTIGINAPAAADHVLYDNYLATLTSSYDTTKSLAGVENFYDGAYFLLYSAAAASPTLTDGASMARGMVNLVNLQQGEKHEMGQGNMPQTLQAIARGPIALYGTLGPPNFNPVSGGRDDYGSVWCIDSTNNIKPDVLTYQTSDSTMAGTFPCFTGF
jgi:hypothetical protein